MLSARIGPWSAYLLLAATTFGFAASASATEPCASADATAPDTSAKELARSVGCLVNQERLARDLPGLVVNKRLARAAAGHARDMVTRGYFSHDTLGGGDFASRIRDAGYAAPRAFAHFGEDLGWGTGRLGSPRSIVRTWMASQDHGARIVDPKFREMGVGVAYGDPGQGEAGATYALDLGIRERRPKTRAAPRAAGWMFGRSWVELVSWGSGAR